VLVFLSTLYLLTGNNVWDGSWRMLITIIMWLVFIKGVAYILAPNIVAKMAKRMAMDSINLYGIIAIAAGIYLFYLG